jgi:hypothetical protein
MPVKGQLGDAFEVLNSPPAYIAADMTRSQTIHTHPRRNHACEDEVSFPSEGFRIQYIYVCMYFTPGVRTYTARKDNEKTKTRHCSVVRVYAYQQ